MWDESDSMRETSCKAVQKNLYIIYASRSLRKRPEDIGGKVDSAGDKKGDKVQ
jgi:hypothetical protein